MLFSIIILDKILYNALNRFSKTFIMDMASKNGINWSDKSDSRDHTPTSI